MLIFMLCLLPTIGQCMAGCGGDLKKTFRWTTAWPMEENYVTYKLIGPLEETQQQPQTQSQTKNFGRSSSLNKFNDDMRHDPVQKTVMKNVSTNDNAGRSISVPKIGQSVSKFNCDAELEECLSCKMGRYNDDQELKNEILSSAMSGTFPNCKNSPRVKNLDSRNGGRNSFYSDAKSMSNYDNNSPDFVKEHPQVYQATKTNEPDPSGILNAYLSGITVAKSPTVYSAKAEESKALKIDPLLRSKLPIDIGGFSAPSYDVGNISTLNSQVSFNEKTIKSVCRSQKIPKNLKMKGLPPYKQGLKKRIKGVGQHSKSQASLRKDNINELKTKPVYSKSNRSNVMKYKKPFTAADAARIEKSREKAGGSHSSSWFDFGPWFKSGSSW